VDELGFLEAGLWWVTKVTREVFPVVPSVSLLQIVASIEWAIYSLQK
jgi:hypothetical protein